MFHSFLYFELSPLAKQDYWTSDRG